MGEFTPRLDILPDRQRKLWPRLSVVPRDFVLYGGTALALRFGHRQSADFDFFSDREFRPDDLVAEIPLLRGSTPEQAVPNTLTVDVDGTRLSFFGGVGFPVLAPADLIGENSLAVASPLDLAGTKAKVLLDRIEVKDYLDISALLTAGLSLDWIIGSFVALFPQGNPMLVARALAFFDDPALAELPVKARRQLTTAVAKTRQYRTPEPSFPSISIGVRAVRAAAT